MFCIAFDVGDWILNRNRYRMGESESPRDWVWSTPHESRCTVLKLQELQSRFVLLGCGIGPGHPADFALSWRETCCCSGYRIGKLVPWNHCQLKISTLPLRQQFPFHCAMPSFSSFCAWCALQSHFMQIRPGPPRQIFSTPGSTSSESNINEIELFV
jgi:hypothetical protein